jgi:hypothetical protein
MRKKVLTMLIAAVIGTAAYAEVSVSLDIAPLLKGFIASEKGKNGADDTSILGIGAGVEVPFAAHYSAGAKLDFYSSTTGNTDGLYFSGAVEGRLYPISEAHDKFFMALDIGYNYFSAKKDGAKIDAAEISGLTFDLKAGYKEQIGMFFLEPSISYVLAKSNSYANFTPLGWQLGLNAGMSLFNKGGQL